jgi:hypothetical protein
MVLTLSFILPYLLLLYFLIRSVNKQIYLFGVAFLIYFHFSIFFENVKIFAVPGRFDTNILFAAWLIILWMIFKIINYYQLRNRKGFTPEKGGRSSIDYLIIGLMIITILDLFIVYVEHLRIENVFTEFITIFSLFLGFFIIKEVFRYYSPGIIAEFLFSIVIVNSLASVLYIVHQGLHLGLYLNEEYLSEVFRGEVITRTFWFMPPLWFLSICYLLVIKKGKSILYFILLIINLIALFISYTRSFLIITFIILILYYLLNAYKNKNFYAAAKNILLTIIAGLVLLVVISKIFPTSTNYFLNRFVELKQGLHDVESNSLLYRFSRTGAILNKIEPDKLIIGYGPVTEVQSSLVGSMRVVTWDLVWTGVVFRWGIIGLVLFILLYIISIVKAFNLFIKKDGISSQLALMLLLVIVSQLIESFVSATFMSSDRYAMGLWYLGILSAVIIADKNFSDSTDKDQNDVRNAILEPEDKKANNK